MAWIDLSVHARATPPEIDHPQSRLLRQLERGPGRIMPESLTDGAQSFAHQAAPSAVAGVLGEEGGHPAGSQLARGRVEVGPQHLVHLDMRADHAPDVFGHRPVGAAVPCQIGRDAGELVLQRDLQLDQIVFAPLVAGGVETGVVAQIAQRAAPDQRRAAVRDEIPIEVPIEHPAFHHRGRRGIDDAAAGVDAAIPVVDQTQAGRAVHEALVLQPQLVGMPQVVGVERRDEIPARGVDTCIARRGHAAVRLRNHPHARILRRVPLRHAAGRVLGPVVDDDDLQVGVSLSQHRPHGLIERRHGVVSGNNDRDQVRHQPTSR